VHLCRTPEDIDKIPEPVTPMIIQEAIPGPGEDLKIYCVGDQVQGVRKQFSESSFSVAGRHGEITDEVRRISQRVGEVCGLGLYGLDIIESDRGPYVVDVNYFPGYKGVPNAAGMIADYIDDYAKGKVALKPPVPQ
jgi:ribosomal protein S6--L-glutamate ligase